METAAFAFGPADELIGYSLWPWDSLYRPVVGLFVGGRLSGHAVCDLTRPVFMPVVAVTLQARAIRKLRGVRITPQPIALEGPDAPCWFRMIVAPEIVGRLRQGDPTVRLARLEDGEAVVWAERRVEAPGATPPSGPLTVEALLALKSAEPPRTPLDGFPAFAETPFTHQLDITFVELLRRLPDPPAREGYLPQLQSGAITLFDLRRMVMESEEFRARRIGLQDRVGALYTSTLWHDLANWPTLAARARRPVVFCIDGLQDRSDTAFVDAAYKVFLDREPDEAGRAHYLHVAATSGRRAVAVELGRWARLRGETVDVV